MNKHLPVGLLVLLLTAALPALAGPDRDWGVGTYMDQDLAFPFLNEDRDYTMGIAAEFFWQNKDEGVYVLDGTAKRIGEWLGLHNKRDAIVRSFMLGSVNYTPDDLADPKPIYDDRPYASLLYLTNKRVRANSRSAVGVEVQLGILGTRLAGDVQGRLHSLWRAATGDSEPVDPKGWTHQISDGGEPTLRLRLTHSRLLAESEQHHWDLAGTGTATLGYQTNLSAGLAARAGNIHSNFWSLPFDPVNRGNFLPSLHGDEWYVWSAYRMRLVGYDAMLQGQFADSDVTFGSDQIERVLHEGAVGVTLAHGPIQATFAINGKTAELKDGIGRRNHVWGGIYLVFRH